jgi:prepilin-type processing-associated H-X9-DG protein
MGRYVTSSTSVSWPDVSQIYQRLSHAENPSRKILAGDALSYDFGGYWDFENPPDEDLLARHRRHLGGINLLFADGHYDWMPENTIRQKVADRTLFNE